MDPLIIEKERVVKKNQSKYDFVKVRIWVNDHFYVLSRYLVSRALVSTKIDYKSAVQISLDLKRTLVDLRLTDIVQEQFEDFLYKTMRIFGYDDTFTNRYRMISTFHRNRVPLLIILAGTSCIGKSTLAMKLADRLNLSSVLQTDVIFELLRNVNRYSLNDAKNDQKSLDIIDKDELDLETYKKNCALVRKGVEMDIEKCLKGGKSLIVEGFHIDPILYGEDIRATCKLEGIVVPILLSIEPNDHLEFLRSSPGPSFQAKGNDLTTQELQLEVSKRQQVQLYLEQQISCCNNSNIKSSESSQKMNDVLPFTKICMNLHSFNETVDHVHDIVLQEIEQMYHKQYTENEITSSS